MPKHRFTDAEHFAVWHTYSGRYFWCGHPLRLQDVTIDHVIAESLGDDREEFEKLKTGYALPDDFQVNDFRNWMPACIGCNAQKGQRTYSPSVVFLGALERTCRHGVDAKREAEKIIGNKREDQLLGRIRAAVEPAI